MVIENDANYISIAGMEYRIGGELNGISELGNFHNLIYHSVLTWNADGSVLTIKSADLNHDYIEDSSMDTTISNVTLTMKDGQIIVDGKDVNFQDMTQSDQTTLHCVFSRIK